MLEQVLEIFRGTTPTITLSVNADLRNWCVYVTLKCGMKEITIEGDSVSIDYNKGVSKVRFMLSQEQTLSFDEGFGEIQLRATNGFSAVASVIRKVKVNRILLDGVIDGCLS